MVVAQAAGNAEGKGPVGLCQEAHIPESGVDGVVHSVTKSDLQFTGHMDVPADGKQILCGSLGVRRHIKCLAGLDSGQRAAHDVPGIVAAASPGDDAAADSRFHDLRDLLRFQVVELHRLAGGQLHQANAVFFHDFRQKAQALHRQAATGHPQAQHVPGRIPLGVRAHAAGHTLVVFPFNITLVKRCDLFSKGSDFRAICLHPLFIHHSFIQPFFVPS